LNSDFCDWCSGRNIDPVRVTVQQLADFLVYLFEIKQLVPSTIKGYRSAIGRIISLLGGPDFVDCLTDLEMCEVAPSEKRFWRSPSPRVAKREDEEILALDVPFFPWTETEDLVWKKVLEAWHKTEADVLETMLVLARLVQ
jgi:hypothetical protein